jgi:hypothetical protein
MDDEQHQMLKEEEQRLTPCWTQTRLLTSPPPTTAPYAGVLEKGPRLFRSPRTRTGEGGRSERGRVQLSGLLRKARKDTREEESAQEEALIIAEQIALLRKAEGRRSRRVGERLWTELQAGPGAVT